ncbi:MAG: xyloglucanase precursor, partial [Bacteroidetes bacterium]|nr:xyloglucanase precursor [Bacteroidota bacterium]
MEKFEAMKPRSIGPAGMSGRVTAIDALHGDPDIIFAGTASGGLWRSTSGGVEWEPIFDEESAHSIGAIAINQSNPDVIWVGTGEGNPRNSVSAGNGLFKTIDGGSSWTHLGLDETRSIHRILLHPDNPEVAYIGALGPIYGETETRGVFKTTDGGKSFEKILYENERTGVGDMVMDPSNPDHILVAMWEFRRWPWFFKSGGPGSALHVTYDGGETWKRQTDEEGLPEGELGRIGLAFSQSDPNVAYALVEAKKNALFRSINGGDSWTKVNDSDEVTQRPFYYLDIFVDSANENR